MITIDDRGFEAVARGNAAFLRQAAKVLKNSLTRTLRRTATTVRQDIRSQSGLGRSVWGEKASGLTRQKLVTIIKPRAGGDSIETGLSFRGLPKLIEEGGTIKAHAIRPSKGKLLVFEVNGKIVAARAVRHPGARVRAHGFGGSALRRNETAIAEDLNRSLQNLVNQAYAASGGNFEESFG